jgi:hypothetical protein
MERNMHTHVHVQTPLSKRCRNNKIMMREREEKAKICIVLYCIAVFPFCNMFLLFLYLFNVVDQVRQGVDGDLTEQDANIDKHLEGGE